MENYIALKDPYILLCEQTAALVQFSGRWLYIVSGLKIELALRFVYIPAKSPMRAINGTYQPFTNRLRNSLLDTIVIIIKTRRSIIDHIDLMTFVKTIQVFSITTAVCWYRVCWYIIYILRQCPRNVIGLRSGFSGHDIFSVYLWCWWQGTKTGWIARVNCD